MIHWNEAMNKQFAIIKMISIVILIIAPIIYIVIANSITVQENENAQFGDMMFYILLIMALVQPMILPLLEKNNLKVYMKQKSKPEPIKFYMTISIIKAAFVESIFIYGFVVFFITGDITRMYYFYPIGIIWIAFIFPTKSRCESFLEKVASYGKTNPIG